MSSRMSWWNYSFNQSSTHQSMPTPWRSIRRIEITEMWNDTLPSQTDWSCQVFEKSTRIHSGLNYWTDMPWTLLLYGTMRQHPRRILQWTCREPGVAFFFQQPWPVQRPSGCFRSDLRTVRVQPPKGVPEISPERARKRESSQCRHPRVTCSTRCWSKRKWVTG